ncbi:unnamed protein product [Mytilus coruscus]|uniref:Integrase p58-like C-terminal domain-containing protein n=1 Tax=Mytilus coruscus TaxID=42192 RepID=A0A6J8BZZ9_MYTCO|nr:unnamed protein product [Mytilus coruscus]
MLGLGWTGPYKGIKKITDLTYRIQKDTSTKQLVVHVDHLKPYQAAHTPTIQEQTLTAQENIQTLPPPVTSCFDPKDVLPYRVGDANERKEAQHTREKVNERQRKAKEDAQET